MLVYYVFCKDAHGRRASQSKLYDYLFLSVIKLHQRPRGGGHLRLCQQVPGDDDKGAPSTPTHTTAAIHPQSEAIPDGLHGLAEVDSV